MCNVCLYGDLSKTLLYPNASESMHAAAAMQAAEVYQLLYLNLLYSKPLVVLIRVCQVLPQNPSVIIEKLFTLTQKRSNKSW
jgi:hypothetical protein